MVERIKNFGAQIIVCLAETFSARVHPKKNMHPVRPFSEIVQHIVYLIWTLVIHKTCQFVTLLGNTT